MKNKIQLIGFLLLLTLTTYAKNGLTLSGTIQNRDGDTVFLTAWSNLLSMNKKEFLPQQKLSAIIKNGHFSMVVTPMQGAFYFTLSIQKNGRLTELLDYFIAEPGDSLNLDITGNRIDFTGNRINKYLYQYEAAQSQPGLAKKYAVYRVIDSSNYEAYTRELVENRLGMLKEQLGNLEKWKDQLSPDLYDAFSSDKKGNAGTIICNYRERSVKIGAARYFKNPVTIRETQSRLYRFFDSLLQNPLFAERPVNKTIVPKDWISFLLAKNSFCPTDCPKDSLTEKILHLRIPYQDQVQTLYLIDRYEFLANPGESIGKALRSIQNTACRSILEDLQSMLSGKPAYDFALQDRNKKIRHLHEFTNKVVVLDFWFTGCTNCIIFFHDLIQPLEHAFTDTSRVVFVTISTDKLFETWTASIPANTYTSEQAINLYTGGKGVTDQVIDGYKIRGYPTGVIIDKKGFIHKILTGNNAYKEVSNILTTLSQQ